MMKYSLKSRLSVPINIGIAGTLLVLAACSGDGRPFTEAVEANDLQLKTLSIVQPFGLLPDLVVNPGTQLTLGLTATNMADEQISVSSTNRRWSVNNPAVATIDENGNLSAEAAGVALVTVRVGAVGSFDFEVEVREEMLDSIASIEGDASMERCLPKEYRAVGRYVSADGSTNSLRALPNAQWTVGNVEVGSVAKPVGGFVSATGVNEGLLNLIATVDGVSGNREISITSTLQSIRIGPQNMVVPLGTTLSLIASGYYVDGDVERTDVDITESVNWSVLEDNTVFSVGNTVFNKGIVTPLIEGSDPVFVSCGNLQQQRTVLVTEELQSSTESLSFVDASPLTLSLASGSRQLQVFTGSSLTDDSEKTEDAVWSVITGADVVVFNSTGFNGQITPISVGNAIVRAEYEGQEIDLSITVVAP